VTHLYNRNLFSSFPVKDIQLALSDALQYVTEATVHESIRDSILSRLRLRINFLSALERGLEVAEDRTSEEWLSCLRILPSVIDTNSLGKPVEESFSLKIQRRLASSVPPRPMVKISFEDAMVDLKRLCKDTIDILQVLDFHGSNNLLVSLSSFLEHVCTIATYKVRGWERRGCHHSPYTCSPCCS
jgi:N-alpha-acetyltransferase 35, NatC auxiliary subunit